MRCLTGEVGQEWRGNMKMWKTTESVERKEKNQTPGKSKEYEEKEGLYTAMWFSND